MSTQQLALLEQLMRKECRNIKLTETEWGIDNDPTSLTQSKVLGSGFFPAYLEEDYPRSKEGVPFVMLVQINFAAVAPMEGMPKSGLLQLYVNPFSWSDGYEVLYFDDEELGEEPLDVYHDVLRGWLEDADYALPVNRVHTMTFEEGYSYFGDCDRYFEERLDQLRCDFSEEAIDAYLQKHRGNYGSRIGGYCDFAQYDPRRSDSLLHILQLDSEEGINFCDCGVLHLFINKESAEAKDWEDTIRYVDWY